MDLRTILTTARKQGSNNDQVYLILALIDQKMFDTPYYAGMADVDLTINLLALLRVRELAFYQEHKLDWDKDDFFTYLLAGQELTGNAVILSEVYKTIRKEGEERYEFKNIDRVV